MAERRRIVPGLVLLPLLLFSACSSGAADQELLVTLVADGQERAFLLTGPLTVGAFLRDAEIVPGRLDRLEPQAETWLQDGMRVTLVRVHEQEVCRRHELPYEVRSVSGRPPEPATSELLQAGSPGVEEHCVLVRTEDGQSRDVMELGRVVIREAVDELWQDDPQQAVAPLPLAGTLAWIRDGDAWVASGDSSRLRQFTHSGDLDGRVLALSADGARLLYTRTPGDAGQTAARNQLWLAPVEDTSAAGLRLLPEEVLTAAWLPGSAEEFGYVTVAASHTLAHMQVNPDTGEVLSFRELHAPAAGPRQPLAQTHFLWSPDGTRLAWAQSDAVGLLESAGGARGTLLHSRAAGVPETTCALPQLSWSPDSRFLMTVSRAEDGAQPAVFVTNVAEDYRVRLFSAVSPCAVPTFAPALAEGGLVFLRARDPARPNSRAGHDLMHADRDGSNLRRLFPDVGRPGLQAGQIAWSPDAQQLALVYQGQLWLLDIRSAAARALAAADDAASPVWAG